MQQPQMQIDLSKTVGIKCSECGSNFFDQTMIIRQVSRLYTGASEDQPVIVPVFLCHHCGAPLKKYFPAGMEDVERDLGLTLVDETEPKTVKLYQ